MIIHMHTFELHTQLNMFTKNTLKMHKLQCKRWFDLPEVVARNVDVVGIDSEINIFY